MKRMEFESLKQRTFLEFCWFVSQLPTCLALTFRCIFFLVLETLSFVIHIHRPWSRHDKFSVLIAGEGRTKLNYNSGGISNNEGLFSCPQHSVTYASVYDNTVLRTFSGHSSKVTNLSMSPVDDRFLSSSDDRTIRLWNIQQPGCIAMIPPIPNGIPDATAPYACFDSSGLVFAVTSSLPGTSGNVGPISVFFAHCIFLLFSSQQLLILKTFCSIFISRRYIYMMRESMKTDPFQN